MTTTSSHDDLERPPLATERTPLLSQLGAAAARQPRGRALLPARNTRFVTTKGVHMVHSGSKINYIDRKLDIDKIIAFNPDDVLGWTALLTFKGTIFEMDGLMEKLVANGVLGIFVAALSTRFPTVSKDSFNTDLLDTLIKFLMAFLAFMTGMFVNGAFKRWQDILTQLFGVFQSMKNLYMDLAMHGAPELALDDIRRWGLLSVKLAAIEAPAQWDPPNWDNEYRDLSEEGLLNDEEKEALLEKVGGHKATLVWTWIFMKMQELTVQGFVPPRTTPALVKMLDHCHRAKGCIERINELITFQVPHQYMHMLAFLIHLFNIVNTFRCGLEMGSVFEAARKSGSPTLMQIQSLIAYGTIMLISPFIYQAFLCIGLDISIPFGNGSTDLPVRFLIDRCNQEMDDMSDSLRNPARGGALPAGRPGTYTGSKFTPSAPGKKECGVS